GHGSVAGLDRQNRQHGVTTFRKDIKTDGRHAVVEFGVSLMDDLARRDFTINAIAYHPIRHEWRDPFHGADDLARKLIRSVGDANWRFQEDYLRILRALRFSAASSRPTRTSSAGGPSASGATSIRIRSTFPKCGAGCHRWVSMPTICSSCSPLPAPRSRASWRPSAPRKIP